jgi:hypothetical protein
VTPAAFGVIHAALQALDADLSDERLDSLADESLCAIWQASGDVCKIANSLHDRLHSAVVGAFTRPSRDPAA